MNSWKIILATVVIFGCGVVTGGLLVNYVQHPRPGGHRPAAGNRSSDLPLPRAQILNAEFVQQLDARLHLTPEQRNKITKIIAQGQQRNHELWRLVAPQMRLVIQDVHQKIRAVLTPEQKKQFGALMKQLAPRRPPASANSRATSPPTNRPPDLSTNVPLRGK